MLFPILGFHISINILHDSQYANAYNSLISVWNDLINLANQVDDNSNPIFEKCQPLFVNSRKVLVVSTDSKIEIEVRIGLT